MTVKEMYDIVMELVGLTEMPEDSGIVYDNGKEVKRVLAGIDMDTTMLMLAKQLGFDCVAQHLADGVDFERVRRCLRTHPLGNQMIA